MKSKKPLIKRVILFPNYIVSKRDGQWHYIGSSKLARLYGVLPTDVVKIYSGRPLMPKDQEIREGWISLWPRRDGDYKDIHANDHLHINNLGKV